MREMENLLEEYLELVEETKKIECRKKEILNEMQEHMSLLDPNIYLLRQICQSKTNEHETDNNDEFIRRLMYLIVYSN